MIHSPYLFKSVRVPSVRVRVLVALLPGIAAYVWLSGAAILLQLALASVTALIAEALVLAARRKPLKRFLTDGSALITAWLIALSFPPPAPWWLTVLGTLAAIVAKHFYGDLGKNRFNPAMVGLALMLLACPTTTSHNSPAIFGHLGGTGWPWITLAYLAGGLWLLQQRIITWHMPAAFFGALALISGVFGLLASTQFTQFAGPWFQVLSGGSTLAAFFIVTDPVTGTTTPKGKLIFAAGIGLLTGIIHTLGNYPGGIAFSVLLMNIAAPMIDKHTRPPVFGHKLKHNSGNIATKSTQ